MICEQFKINRWQWANRRLREPDAVREARARPASQPCCSYRHLLRGARLSLFAVATLIASLSTSCPTSQLLPIHSFDCLIAFCGYPILSLCLFQILFCSTIYFSLFFFFLSYFQTSLKRSHWLVKVITTRNEMLLLGRAENHILSHSPVSCPDTILGLITSSQIHRFHDVQHGNLDTNSLLLLRSERENVGGRHLENNKLCSAELIQVLSVPSPKHLQSRSW